ncbi:hypothetical protein P9D39_21800 [Heyndrickxia oleronia]|uniref:Uncharacterized protein n=1 Tax=Heyndrickxia oleronia TaxID=38875 RepID=A0A8E2LGD4_9BACI|nr:hypothetical protein [Heyndrickxia oleronia]MEC1376933.1 hypothetical protein [Heyndrickxia oleronia]OOP69049.1 hypothetical protein BWZ43_06890 [Heyndrickxia oleronia]QQZ05521.1 hypothetical protein I5818_03215 [Heyndrickxia oleronia]
MIKNRRLFTLSLFLLGLYIVLILPYPNSYSLGETIIRNWYTPAKTYYVTNVLFLLVLLGLILLGISLKKFRYRLIILTTIIIANIPPTVTNFVQKHFSSGIYAISYDQQLSQCHFQTKNKHTMHAQCQLIFENHSNDTVPFTIQIYNHDISDYPNGLTLLKEAGPFDVLVKGNQRTNIKIEKDIDITHLKNDSFSQEISSIDIRIKADTRTRDFIN